ncbi:unnamed protein product [Amoebophrya sp. A120]|nr:unnamed protein product [Amoebophrya sp. A120]|eukprot:GSA120T00023335001.1
MFPSFLLYPIWLLASLLFPAVQSLQALHTEEPATMKLWLFYWVLYAVASWVWNYTFIPLILELPFYVVSTLLFDLFFEAQIAVVVLLVYPKFAYLDKLLTFVTQKEVEAVVKQYVQLAQQKGEALLAQYVDKKKK